MSTFFTMYKIRNNNFNRLKITPKEISDIIEFRYIKFPYFYIVTHSFFLIWAILEMLADYDDPGAWLIFWRIIWFPIKTAIPSLLIFIPISIILSVPRVKLFFLRISSIFQKYFLRYNSLNNLLIDIQKYNINISNFIITCAANNLSLNDKIVSESDKSLTKSKSFIIKSLEAETILRNNPKYNPERFLTLIDFSETLKMTEELNQYSDIFHRNAKISLSVEREMEKLINKKI